MDTNFIFLVSWHLCFQTRYLNISLFDHLLILVSGGLMLVKAAWKLVKLVKKPVVDTMIVFSAK